MNSMYALINGIKLSDLGIYVVNIDSGLKSTPFLPEQEIIEDYAINNDTPYYYGTRKNPLELEVTFSKLDGFWTLDARREFARLLDSEEDEYVEFFVADYTTKIYYVKYVGGIDIFDNGLEQGYLTVQLRCDSPYAYSPWYVEMHDFSENGTNEFIFTNKGDMKCYPEVWIDKVGNGSVEIKNTTNLGNDFKINNIVDKEIVYINNYDGTIESELYNTYDGTYFKNTNPRYSDHNEVYIEMLRGVNRLKVVGKCKIKLKYNFKIKG